MSSPANRLLARPEVLSRLIDGEAVLLQPDTGVYFALNDTGAFLWERLRQGCTEDELFEAMISEFEVEPADLRRDIRELVTSLQENKLISSGNP